ncbi:MAG: GNAT family N-acetyltransferase [Oscillospiraceae bacterium]|nr:GNAT family N-acetyltransferase [Oscillospiraceae bacterium]
MEIEKLGAERAESFFETLTDYYYANSIKCSCLESFTRSDAENKIRSMISHIADGSAIVYGSIGDGELLGYIWAYRISFRDEDRVYVSEVHVSEKCRGQGTGHQLLAAVEEEARKMKVPALYIHTEADNSGAIKLYEREGYRMERVQMRKPLD